MLLETPEHLSSGSILRHWRKVRRLSQMDLAGRVNISTRHLSFVETGRARASHDLLLDLAQALQLPYRHTNSLLMTSGYAPRYTSWSLEDDSSGMIRSALEHLLEQHEPYPAVVCNRGYDIVMMNQGFQNAITWLIGEDALGKFDNTFRLTFADDGLRPFVVGWDRVAGLLLKRLREEAILYQSAELSALYDECSTQAASRHSAQTIDHLAMDHPLPVVTLTLRKGDVELNFFSTITAFGTAIDVTLQELRIESQFPADAQTHAFFWSGHQVDHKTPDNPPKDGGLVQLAGVSPR